MIKRQLFFFLIFFPLICLGDDMKKLLKKAANCYVNKDYLCAEEAIQLAIKIDSTNHDLYINLGTIQNQMGKKEEALQAYSKSLELYPNDIFALNNKAVILIDLNEYQRALYELNKALQISSLNERAKSNRAVVYWKMKNIDSSISDFNDVLKINPKNSDARVNLALLKMEQGEFEEALRNFNILLEQYPDNAKILTYIAEAEMNLKSFENAMVRVNQSIKADPNYIRAYMIRGNIELELDKKELAEKDFQHVLEVGTEDEKKWAKKILGSCIKD